MELLKKEKSDIVAPQFMGVLIHRGRVVISDYSHKDDYNLALAFIGAIGLKPDVQSESWCG